eukprot:scaffold11122_cov128-Skeletonema_marinoi.AAC.6
MSNYYSSNQYYDDDDGESISSGSNNGGMLDGMGSPYQSGAGSGLPNSNNMGMMADNNMDGGVAGIDAPILLNTSFMGGTAGQENNVVDFDDPRIASLPRILLMGPRRAGKTSIQRVVFHKMSPHETLFRLEATQMLERAVVDHTPLCRFTIWDFPGDQYEYGYDVDGTGAGGAGEENGGVDGDGYNDDNEAQPQQQQQQQQSHDYDDQIFSKATALIFVLDAQDEPYDHVLQSFTDTVTRAVRANPTIAVE